MNIIIIVVVIQLNNISLGHDPLLSPELKNWYMISTKYIPDYFTPSLLSPAPSPVFYSRHYQVIVVSGCGFNNLNIHVFHAHPPMFLFAPILA